MCMMLWLLCAASLSLSMAAVLIWLCVMCRYSTALEATGISHTPHCMPIDVAELQDFCRDSGYNVRLERSGTFFTPPSFNVHLTDWERAARLR